MKAIGFFVFAAYLSAFPATSSANQAEPVKIWTEQTIIPTYEALPPDPNPRFLHDRDNQGSKGNVYPHPLRERLSDVKVDKAYTAVYLENEFLKVMVLPEIGGRVHAITDKTNGNEVIYRQHVIKPALIGLFGPWCSGGIEFCFPQHHRPTTFDPVDWALQDNPDGSKTVWVGETDPLYRLRGLAGVSLHPGRSYLEVKIYVFNESFFPKSFLWWANVGVPVNESTQVIFPPDVNYVVFHGKNPVTRFPVPDSVYQGIDFEGKDISWLKNIPVPLSYFAGVSKSDFVGYYDHGKNTGMLHIADHAVSPGKKCWTWGNGNAGEIWEKNLTDTDGPYIEIMAGVFTDNQPDFSWVKPYEVKRAVQYWYPLRNMGYVKSANLEAAVNLEAGDKTAKIAFNTTARHKGASLILTAAGKTVAEEKFDIGPDKPFVADIGLPEGVDENDLAVSVISPEGRELVSYSNLKKEPGLIPEPFKKIPDPGEIKTIDDLLIAGMHIDQYKTPARDPEPLYLEVLNRDPENREANTALGLLAMRQGKFTDAEKYLLVATKRAVAKNQNPYNTEPFFNLGALLKLQGRTDEAVESFNKCLWDAAFKGPAYYALSQLACIKGNPLKALEHIDNSLASNDRNPAALCLKSAILRKLGKAADAEKAALAAKDNDILFFRAYNEIALDRKASKKAQEAEATISEMKKLMRNQPESYIDVAQGYAEAGMWEEGIDVLETLTAQAAPPEKAYPLAYYYLAHYSRQLGRDRQASQYYALAAKANPDFCFPARLSDIAVLEAAIQANPGDARARYYLGNLLYDKKQFEPGIANWEKAKAIDDKYWLVNRNLGFAYNEFEKDQAKAIAAYEKALSQNPNDITTVNELYQLYKAAKWTPGKRGAFLEKHGELVVRFDTLTVHKIALLVQTGQYDEALGILTTRLFHPWEGNAFSLHKLYETARLLRGLDLMKQKKNNEALKNFEAALLSPDGLRDENNPENPFYYAGPVYFYCALAYEALGNKEKAREFLGKTIDARASERAAASGYFLARARKSAGNPSEAAEAFAGLVERGKKLVADSRDETKDGRDAGRIAEGWYLQGLGLAGQGDEANARAAFQRALEADMDHFGALVALKELAYED